MSFAGHCEGGKEELSGEMSIKKKKNLKKKRAFGIISFKKKLHKSSFFVLFFFLVHPRVRGLSVLFLRQLQRERLASFSCLLWYSFLSAFECMLTHTVFFSFSLT